MDLAAAKEIRLVAKMSYLRFGPLGNNLAELFDELDFVVSFLVNGPGIGDMVIVLVQAPLEKV